jgi:sulfate/thiosulfate transport system ATP-binding protein
MAGAITVRGLTKSFGAFRAVDDVSFEARAGEITALLGPSGSGKSTVLRMIAGLEQPDAGSIWVGGEEHTSKTPQERGLGFVFQHYALFRHMNVRQNVEFGLKVRKAPPIQARSRVDELLDLVGLRPFGDRYPDQLSGGQRQRVALARALAPRPEVLLLDEPFGALDAHVRQELRRWLDRLHRELGVTSLLVTHDQEEALELASAVVVMRRGRVEQAAPPVDIYNRPTTPFVAGFVGASNVVRGTVQQAGLHFGSSAVAGADHVPDGTQAQAYIRPHDVLLTRNRAVRSFPVTVERKTDLGWLSKLQLRLADGQAIFAELPNEELDGIEEGEHVYANLRNAKVFSLDAGDPPAGPADGVADPAGLHTSDENEALAAAGERTW